MKKYLTVLLISGVLFGCSAIDPKQSPKVYTNTIEIGTKQGAKSMIVFDYLNTTAKPEYQHYIVSLFLKDLPEDKQFVTCDSYIAKTDCQSRVAVWQNQLVQNPETVWVDFNLKMLLDKRKVLGEILPQIKSTETRLSLSWGVTENITFKKVSGKNGNETIDRLDVTAYRL